MASYEQYYFDFDAIQSVGRVRVGSPPNRNLYMKILIGSVAALILLCVVGAITALAFVAVKNAQPSSTVTTETTTTATTTTATTSTSTTTLTAITFTPVGIYALTIPTCATWNQTGNPMAGNQNGTIGTDLSSLNYPVSIFIDNNDVLYVCDRDNSRILQFYPN